MTVHAVEEMAEDDLDILDVEEAVLNGRVVRSNKHDPRGTIYTVQGRAGNGEKVIGIVGRFHSPSHFLIITVYDVSKLH